MTEQSQSQAGKSATLALEKSENTASHEITTKGQRKATRSASNKTKIENNSAQNTDESAKPKSGKPATRIPVKSSGKQSKRNAENSATKTTDPNAKTPDENNYKIDQNSSKIDHNRNKTEPNPTELLEDQHPASAVLKTHQNQVLQNELLEKTKLIDSLQKQLNDVKVEQAEKMPLETDFVSKEITIDTAKSQEESNQEDATNSEELERKVALLSEENYELRERLLHKDVEIEQLKNEEPKVQENIVQKILRKENAQLHHEKEQLKLERDRLKHLVNEKQDKAEKLVAGLKDMEDQLFQAKRALEDRAKASTRLEGRFAKIDSELNRYRERYGKLEKQDKTKRLSEKSKSSRSRSLSPGGREKFESEQDYSQNQVTMLQQREAKLLGDRRQLEKSVNLLTNKITTLEDKLRTCRSEKRPTHERGSQTDLGVSTQLTSTMIGQGHAQGHSEGSAVQRGTTGDTARKCRGIVQSLRKFFEELIQNNQDTSAGGSKSRRTTIAARRAHELLHELSISMENVLSAKSHEPNCAERSTSPVRRSTTVNTETSKTMWDKLCEEVARHEFTFDPLSPPLQTEHASSDKEQELKRAERGLQRTYHENGEASGDTGKDDAGFTKEDATKMMNVSRKQTESVMKDLLRKHQGEIRALLENACQSSPVPTMAFDISSLNPDISGQDEATIAVKELDGFKTRTTKVQSLILKLQEIVECAKKDKQSAEQKLQNLADEIRQKDTLLQAKSLELRRRHGRTLESEKALQAQIGTLKDERAAILKENARLHDVCRQKDLQILQKVQEIKSTQQQVDEREKAHQHNLATMRKKVEQAWGLYESVKSRAEKRTAEFSEAAEKLKASQGYLLDLWQTLKTVDNVVEANEHDEL